jgi:hypothetical protein
MNNPTNDNRPTDPVATATSSDLDHEMYVMETAPDGSQVVFRIRPAWGKPVSKYVN